MKYIVSILMAVALVSPALAAEVPVESPVVVPPYVIPLWALGPNQNLVRSNFSPEIWNAKQVFRDSQDNFFIDGYHINLAEFKNLGINADFVARGATVSLGVAVGR